MSLSKTELNELLTAAEEMTNAMSESWRELVSLPFHVQAEQREKKARLVQGKKMFDVRTALL